MPPDSSTIMDLIALWPIAGAATPAVAAIRVLTYGFFGYTTPG